MNPRTSEMVYRQLEYASASLVVLYDDSFLHAFISCYIYSNEASEYRSELDTATEPNLPV